jgi:hypothetical protein
MLVLDANILIRAVLGRRVRQLLETNTGRGTTPEKAKPPRRTASLEDYWQFRFFHLSVAITSFAATASFSFEKTLL